MEIEDLTMTFDDQSMFQSVPNRIKSPRFSQFQIESNQTRCYKCKGLNVLGVSVILTHKDKERISHLTHVKKPP